MQTFNFQRSTRILAILPWLAILAGGSIYLFVRPLEPMFFAWIGDSGLEGLLNRVRPATPEILPLFPEWVIYSLPHGLWAFAYAWIITRQWRGQRYPVRFFWWGSIPMLTLGIELLQALDWIPGTFAWTDLLLASAGAATGVILSYLIRKTPIHES